MEYKPKHRYISSAKTLSDGHKMMMITLVAVVSVLSTEAQLQINRPKLLKRYSELYESDKRLTPLGEIQNGQMITPHHGFTTSSDSPENNPHTSQKTKEPVRPNQKHYSERNTGQKSRARNVGSETDKHAIFRREIRTGSSRENSRKNRKPKSLPEVPSSNNNPSSPNSQGPSCRSPHQQNVTDAEGRIVWTEPKSGCFVSKQWLISVVAGHGMVFEFASINMLNGFSFTIQEVASQTVIPKSPPLWVFSESNFMAPLLVRSSQVLVEVKTPPSRPQSLNTPWLSRFNLSYAAHPLVFMPPKITGDEEDGFSISRVIYNCNLYPKKIPKALQCDMVPQCVAGEDEEDCSYKSAGCGDWVPYRDQCFRAFFKPVTELGPGRSHVTMPFPAKRVCMNKFQARLAEFPDSMGMQLAAKILHQSGYHSAAVGLRKVRPRSVEVKHFYKYMWQWGKRGSPIAYEQVEIQRMNAVVDCAVFDLTVDFYLKPLACNAASSRDSVPEGFICMKFNTLKYPEIKKRRLYELHLQPAMEPVAVFPTKICPDGSLVQTFHACEWNSFRENRIQGQSVFRSFKCQLGRSVPYTCVCDTIYDCADGSDEINCMAPKFKPLLSTTFTCNNLQTIPKTEQCDGVNDCFDSSDEEDCIICKKPTYLCPSLGCIPNRYKDYFESCEVPKRPDSPVLQSKVSAMTAVILDGFGMSSLRRARKNCSEGYFPCDDSLCIPTFLLNNGEQDCPSGIDEGIPTDSLTCPGYYRCHLSGNCIHSKHVCDGIPHCPNKDDERYCDLRCPLNCTCEGYAFRCLSMFEPNNYLSTRYLDISGVIQPNLNNIQNMEYLLLLNLSHCDLKDVNLTSMPQLKILDLSYNVLEGLSSINFFELTGLQYLSLSNNPLITKLDSTFCQFVKASGFIHLKELSLVNTGLRSIADDAIGSLPELVKLDLRQNDITDFDRNVFSGLHLGKLHADNYKLCCSYFHPTAILECHAPGDELSSCDDLLRSRFYQISVWILAVFNIPANVAVLVYRLWEVKKKKSKSHTILVGNLCLSDMLMGIYLVFIGSADVHYRDVWVSKETEWTSSELCKTAGILAFLSSEVSAFVVCLITLERLLVMCFPFRRCLHMSNRTAWLACIVAWLLGLLLATVPAMAGWQLYGQNGFCLPLPITRIQFPGQKYVFAVFIYINFILFIFIGIGQICIYRAIKKTRLSTTSSNKLQDTTIARRLMFIIITDFLCWFPIGLMGVLSSLGTRIPGEVNVWAALFILPFNSALNPHLYTINSLLDQYREYRMDRRIQKTIGKINAEISKWPADKVESLLKSCLQAKVIQKKKVLQWIRQENNPEVTEELELEEHKEHVDSRLDTDLHTEANLCAY